MPCQPPAAIAHAHSLGFDSLLSRSLCILRGAACLCIAMFGGCPRLKSRSKPSTCRAVQLQGWGTLPGLSSAPKCELPSLYPVPLTIRVLEANARHDCMREDAARSCWAQHLQSRGLKSAVCLPVLSVCASNSWMSQHCHPGQDLQPLDF